MSEVARRLGNEANEQGEEAGRDCLAAEHVSPTRRHRPLRSGIDGCDALSHLLHKRLDVVAQDEEVHEIDDKLAEDNGELVPADQHAPDFRRSYLADVHGADGRRQADADAADDAVEVEHEEQREERFAVLEEQELRLHASQGGNEKQQSRDDERLLSAQPRGQIARQQRADDAADERAGRGEAVPKVVVLKVAGLHEECLQTLLSTRDDGCVITEKQSAENCNKNDGVKIGLTARLLCLIHVSFRYKNAVFRTKIVFFPERPFASDVFLQNKFENS